MDTTAELLLRQARPDEALTLLTQAVRARPADAKQRVFLFQLLAVLGQWDRARDQLNACRELDGDNAALASTYAILVQAERQRAAVFAGSALPTIIGEPDAWLARLLQALKLSADGAHAQAAALRAEAFEQAPAVAGSINDDRFEWIADADPRFGPCLELVVNGGYAWVPFSQVQALRFEAPTDLRDTVWAPVAVTWRNGGEALGFVPVRYPGTERSDDGQLLLARRTDWTGVDGDIGLGQRMWATDGGDYPLLDVRQIVFDPV
ncbi:type VI secretion system accessory protein TagJ [Lysobacter cavernae]|uniref:Type VI secretion system accessory protein TagJ n=1 Tax=Lysobacter cavernae TaxID=1685901 RepID=A0ABV7RMX1_9GAMM